MTLTISVPVESGDVELFGEDPYRSARSWHDEAVRLQTIIERVPLPSPSHTSERILAEDPRYLEIRYRGKALVIAVELFLDEAFALRHYLDLKLGLTDEVG